MEVKVFIAALAASGWAQGATEWLNTHKGEAQGRAHKTGREKKRKIKKEEHQRSMIHQDFIFPSAISPIFLEYLCLCHCSDKFLLPIHVPGSCLDFIQTHTHMHIAARKTPSFLLE